MAIKTYFDQITILPKMPKGRKLSPKELTEYTTCTPVRRNKNPFPRQGWELESQNLNRDNRKLAIGALLQNLKTKNPKLKVGDKIHFGKNILTRIK
jgi:hypothetical protein